MKTCTDIKLVIDVCLCICKREKNMKKTTALILTFKRQISIRNIPEDQRSWETIEVKGIEFLNPLLIYNQTLKKLAYRFDYYQLRDIGYIADHIQMYREKKCVFIDCEKTNLTLDGYLRQIIKLDKLGIVTNDPIERLKRTETLYDALLFYTEFIARGIL